ncbi:MAG: pseudouridine synthase [Gemmatimonadota bacterium]
MRLQRFLSRAGVASRRKSERLIEAGRVRVDGEVVTRLGSRVDPSSQTIEVDGREIRLSPLVWLAFHKPPRVLCTRSDPQGRPTMYDRLPDDARELFHVGRLDYMSEGLILLTNEGEAAHALLHPSREVARRYRITLVGPVSDDLPARLEAGVPLSDGPAAADRARFLQSAAPDAPILEVVLHEGRNRELRRMMKALDVRIRRLRRVAHGPIELGALPPGAHRRLGEREVEALRAAARLDDEGARR